MRRVSCLLAALFAAAPALAQEQLEPGAEEEPAADPAHDDAQPTGETDPSVGAGEVPPANLAGVPAAPPVRTCADFDPDAEVVCDGSGPRLLDPDYGYGLEVYAAIGEQLRHVVMPANYQCRSDWDGIEFEFIGLPEGATVHISPGDDLAEIRWRPGRNDIGEHTATARVRADGHPWSEAPLTIVVTEEWETFFMPGVQYSLLVPEAREEFGVIQGVSIQYLVAGWIHRNENRGPSHGRFYIDIDLVRSSESPNLGVLYSMGLTLSFERNPKRQFLIPYFGVELGGIYQKPEDGEKIHAAQVNPLGGISIWASQNFFFNVTAGYMVPFSHMEQLRGLRVKAGMNVSFW